MPERLPGRRLREGPRHRHRQAPGRPVLRLPVLHARLPLRRPQISHRRRGSSASATCAATGSRRARPPPASRPARTRRSASASSTRTRSSRRPRRASSSRPLPAPATRSRRPVTNRRDRCPTGLLAADHFRVVPEHAHPPLVIMLVMTQLAVGGFLVDLAGQARRRRRWPPRDDPAGDQHWLPPHGPRGEHGPPRTAAIRLPALIGLRHSWLSREIATFGLFAGLATNYAALADPRARPGSRRGRACNSPCRRRSSLSGFAGLLSSVMVYHVVRRPFWRAEFSGTKFVGTALVLGLAAAIVAASWASTSGRSSGAGGDPVRPR